MLASNINIKALQVRLGHADVTTTLKDYGHLMPSTQGEAARAVDRILFTDESPKISPN